MRLIISVVLLFSVHAIACGQSGFSGSIGAVLDTTVTIESKTEPPKPDVLTGRSGTAFLGKGRPQGISRYLADSKTHRYTGYDMKVEAAGPGQYRVTFSALTLSAADMNLPDPANWNMSPAPVFPPPQIVTNADTIVLSIMENPATGQKVVDYIQLKRRNCDAVGDGVTKTSCLTSILQDERRALDEKLNRLEGPRGTAARGSQQSWEKYKEDACSALDTEVKRLECEVQLTRSRIHDLGTY
ncbi:MAG: DUF1311 domain-containing protein [Acidobacteriaceae bacterium]|nr:DUF1311 domain-containing protein [Acidobacteriaceae bacterium]